MLSLFLVALFLFTFLCGLLPLLIAINKNLNQYLLAFSGAVLIGIVCLHLLPETFESLRNKAGYLLLTGFFLQLFLQKFSHGIEHGHAHSKEESLFLPIFIGLFVHAFLEGIPLGYYLFGNATSNSMFIAAIAHKAPEVITLMSFIAHLGFQKSKQYLYLLIFSLATPISGLLASYYVKEYAFTSHLISYIVPIVMGAFIHISTTILFESGAKHHQLSFHKVLAVLAGLAIALLTTIDY